MIHRRSGMDVEDIKSELRKKYGPLVHIAEQMGLSRSAISATIRSAAYSIRTEIRIAELLGKTPFAVWGEERFHADNTPVKRNTRSNAVQKVPSHLRKQKVA